MRNNETIHETNEIEKKEIKNYKKRFKRLNKKYIYGFQHYEKVRSFGESIYTGKINIDESEMDQGNLLKK